MLNVNYGRNVGIMNSCKPLRDYAWFIDTIRRYQAEEYSLSEATRLALAESSDDFILKSFLEKNKAEVDGMLLDLYTEENFHKMYKADIAREKEKADAAVAHANAVEARADALEAEVKKLQEENRKLREQISQ